MPSKTGATAISHEHLGDLKIIRGLDPQSRQLDGYLECSRQNFQKGKLNGRQFRARALENNAAKDLDRR